jgi:hypothetical protein
MDPLSAVEIGEDGDIGGASVAKARGGIGKASGAAEGFWLEEWDELT